jgi:hypothetical protein
MRRLGFSVPGRQEGDVSPLVQASIPSTEAIREWFRRTYGREGTEEEVECLRRELRRALSREH